MQNWNAIDILIAEDNDMDAELTLRALREIGVANKFYRVTDGAEALEYVFREGRYAERDLALPKLILLDLKMPKIGGIAALRELRSRPVSSKIPVGILTSSLNETDYFETQEMQVWDYLMKPVNPDALVDLVKQAGI